MLPANLKVKGRGPARQSSGRPTRTRGALGEADYREKLRELKEQLERVDAAPDERRMMTAIKLAQVLAAAWEVARPERRKQLITALFETLKVGDGRNVSVHPKAAVMPLVAVTLTEAGGKDWRSRPDSNRRSRP